MVGDGGANEIRKWLINLSGVSSTPMNYWEKQSIVSLKAWTEALSEGVES